jgi:hypothetical protein
MQHKKLFMTAILPVLIYPAGDAVAQLILGGILTGIFAIAYALAYKFF